MKSIEIINPGPNSKLALTDKPIPSYTTSQLLVHVKATALNHADLFQRLGVYPPPPGESETPGLEVAGEVVAVGHQVSSFKPGDRIYGLTGSGGHAEYCPVNASLAHLLPKDWDYTLAAGLPEALTTVYATLFDIGRIKPGQTLLIHGAGSGIASFAIQMAKLAGAKVLTTVGDSNKIKKAYQLGADLVIAHKEQAFDSLIEEQSVDLIIDYLGGDYFNKHLYLLKSKGKLIQIASLKGSHVTLNLGVIMRKRLQLIGFVLRSQTLAEKARLWKKAHQHGHQWIEHNELKPIIDSKFPLEKVNEAHERMRLSQHFGKIIMIP